MQIPLNVAPCKITGRFLRVVQDGSDADREPDGEPVSGLQVEIKASVTAVRNMRTDPPTWLSLEPIVGYTTSDGRLVGFSDDEDGILVIASDAEGIVPSGDWFYTATITGPGWPTQRITFEAPSNREYNLVTMGEDAPPDVVAAVSELERMRAEFQAKIDSFSGRPDGVLS